MLLSNQGISSGSAACTAGSHTAVSEATEGPPPPSPTSSAQQQPPTQESHYIRITSKGRWIDWTVSDVLGFLEDPEVSFRDLRCVRSPEQWMQALTVIETHRSGHAHVQYICVLYAIERLCTGNH